MSSDPQKNNLKKKPNAIYERIGYFILGRTANQKLARLYAFVILLGFGTLSLPISVNPNSKNYLSNFFTSVSAFTTTGLTIASPKKTLNTFGQFVVLALIQVGGLGVVTIWTFLKHIFFKTKKYTIEERMNLHAERGGVSEGLSYDIVKSAIKTLLTFEAILAAFLTFFFYYIKPESGCQSTSSFKDFWQSLHRGIFHSISAVNNAGLDIISDGNSITSYSKGWGVLLTIVFALASVLGGIGYPVLYEVKEWLFRGPSKRKKSTFSLFTKISLLMYFTITIIAGIAVVASEFLSKNIEKIKPCGLSTAEKIWHLIYLVISSRSAGFTGLDLHSLHEKTQWALLILMFIGASPASTAGGIRSITLFLIIGKIWITMRGRKSLSVFSRTIANSTIDNAYMVFFVSSVLITISSLLITTKTGTSTNIKDHAALFEAASAFGTAGLSLGITGENTTKTGLICLIVLMLIGQMGVPNVLLYYTRPRPSKQNFSNPEEKLRIA